MKPKVLIARPVPQEVEDFLQERCDCKKLGTSGPLSRAQFYKELEDVVGLLTSGTKIDDDLLSHAPSLKVVSNISVGYNNFDLDAMRRHGVMGTHTPTVLDDTVADLVLGLMLAAARRMTELDALVRQGKWQRGMDRELFGVDVHHRTLGIVGLGRIGSAIAKRAKFGFDMEILYTKRTRNLQAEDEFGAVYSDLDGLLRRSDFVVIMTPYTPETEDLIGRAELEKMKPSGILINAGRGKVVDEQALTEALQSGKIRAAGLDVYAEEPVNADNPLLKLPNVVAMPHIGSATEATRRDMAMLAARNLAEAVNGRQPSNPVPELADISLD